MIFNAMRQRGWQGKGLAHMMAWFGEPNKVHRQNRYNSMDPAVISKQLELMQYAGIQGVIVTWMGSVNPFLNTATQRILAECERRGMLFTLLLDPWIAKKSSTQLLDPTQAVTNQLNSLDFKQMLVSPSYLPEKYVLEFDLANSAGVNLTAVKSNFTQLRILSKHVGYSWIEVVNPIPILAKDNSNQAMKIPLLTLGFNDAGFARPDGTRDYSQSVWGGPARVLDNQAGNFWLDQVAITPLWAPYVATVWNDYDEGNTMEQFIAIIKGVRLV